MSEELICELSHNDVIIDAVMMPPAQEMHSPDQSGKTSTKINDEVDTMAVEQRWWLKFLGLQNHLWNQQTNQNVTRENWVRS
uniref:Ovule protein n=1 Tax=Globodera pallida TaxID=36090 RepID=A0A183CAX8_GLOPA